MLAYGSAEASLRLLWKFGLLEVLLPIQVQAHPSSAHAIALSSYPFMHLKHLSDYRDVIALHRLHTLFHKDFEDVTSDQICYWYVLRLSLLASYMLQCQTHQLLFFFFCFNIQSVCDAIPFFTRIQVSYILHYVFDLGENNFSSCGFHPIGFSGFMWAELFALSLREAYFPLVFLHIGVPISSPIINA